MVITETSAQSVWTKQNSGINANFVSVAWTGKIFVVAGRLNDVNKSVIIYSHDAKTWNKVDDSIKAHPICDIGVVTK